MEACQQKTATCVHVSSNKADSCSEPGMHVVQVPAGCALFVGHSHREPGEQMALSSPLGLGPISVCPALGTSLGLAVGH